MMNMRMKGGREGGSGRGGAEGGSASTETVTFD